MIEAEDVAHIVVRSTRAEAVSLLDAAMRLRGYSVVALKGKSHLLSHPNWESPYDPPPPFRCFLMLPEKEGWTTLVDELDRMDWRLLRDLSREVAAISVTGSYARDEYEVRAFVNGVELSRPEHDEVFASAIGAIRSSPDHVTRFPYDEICLRLRGRMSLEFRGYSRS